jgi:predicted DNA-binding transcriptional regulator AlpA
MGINSITSSTGGPLTPLMSTTEVMALLGKTRQTICAWSRKGLLPAVRFPDGSFGFRRDAMENWIAERSTR